MINNYINIRRFVFLTLITFTTAFSQVGIDNPLPDANAILDLKASDKGILIPRMTTIQRFSMLSSCSPSCPNGLLVFDTNKKSFFFLDGNQWYAMSPFTTPDASSGTNEDITTDNTLVQDVGIGIAPAAGLKLHVNGNTSITGTLGVSGDFNTTNLNASGYITSGSFVQSAGNIVSAGLMTANSYGAVGGSQFRSDGASNFSGPVPRGGIIMWSGSATNIPPGWGLCDGSNGTPDLKGRFVLSHGTRPERVRQAGGTIVAGVSKTFNVDDFSGSDKVILDVSELPAHSHSGATEIDGAHKHVIYYSNLSAGGSPTGNMVRHENTGVGADGNTHTNNNSNDGTHSHDFVTDDEGGDAPHSILPPYYVLAYIMKL